VGGSLSYDHEKESVVDLVSPLIYDIYPKKKEPLEKANPSDNIKNFVDESSIHHVLDESAKSEVFDLDVNEVDFLGAKKIFYQILLMLMFLMIFRQKIILYLKVKRSLIPFGRY
jgi:hypothetical protein